MKLVYVAINLPDAHLVRHLLQQAGIPSHVLNEHAVGAMGELPVASACPQVWIAQVHQEHHARTVIEEYQSRRPVTGNKICAACRETNPADFDLCWRCGAMLPVDA
jgi:hypothetical protein